MAEHKPQFIHDPVWRQNYYVSYGTDYEFFRRYYAKRYNIDVGAKSNGRCIEILDDEDHCIAILIWTREKNPAILAHECFHAAAFCLSDRKVPFEKRGLNEPYGYLIEFLMRETLTHG